MTIKITELEKLVITFAQVLFITEVTFPYFNCRLCFNNSLVAYD